MDNMDKIVKAEMENYMNLAEKEGIRFGSDVGSLPRIFHYQKDDLDIWYEIMNNETLIVRKDDKKILHVENKEYKIDANHFLEKFPELKSDPSLAKYLLLHGPKIFL